MSRKKKSYLKKKIKVYLKDQKIYPKEVEQINTRQIKIKNDLETIISSLPNLALHDVPVGKDENSNKEITKIGEITKFDFKPLSHEQLGKKLNKMDFDAATKTSGSRFVFLKNELALLERAISNFMLDIHTKEFGYNEISPPLIVSDSTMFGTGQLPKFESDQFEIKLDDEKSRKFLIPTAEVILTNIVREAFLKKRRIAFKTSCFNCLFQKRSWKLW